MKREYNNPNPLDSVKDDVIEFSSSPKPRDYKVNELFNLPFFFPDLDMPMCNEAQILSERIHSYNFL